MPLSAALLAKIAVPVLLVGGGAAAVAATPDAVSVRADRTPHVWIDAPISGTHLSVGDVDVLVHASGPQGVDTLTLRVDGRSAARTTTLTRTARLVSGTVRWAATGGVHRLVAADDHGTVSSTVVVTVGTTASATATGSATASPTPSRTRTPSSSPSGSTSGAPSTTAPGSRTPTSVPSTTSAPSTTRPPSSSTATADPPVVQRAFVDPGLIYCRRVNDGGGTLPTSATVTAAVEGADTVNARIHGVTFQMNREGGGWVVTVNDRQVEPDPGSNSYAVTVIATGPGGEITASAGDLTVSRC